MNHKKYIQQITTFLFAILFLYNCQQDDLQRPLPESNQNEQKFVTKRVYFDDIENKEIIQQKIESFFYKDNSKSYRSKSVTNNRNYILDTDKIAYIEDDSTHSYTMQLLDLNEPNKFINLLLSSSDGENYAMYRVDYNLNGEEKQLLIQGEYIDLTNKVIFTEIDENHFDRSYQTDSITPDETCYEIEIVEGTCASGEHGHGDSNCSFLGTDKVAPPPYFVITAYDCGGGSGGGGYFPPIDYDPWIGFPPDDRWECPPPPVNPPGGGGGGGNIKNPPKNTTPVPGFIHFDSFYISLGLEKPELYNWLNNPQNSEIKNQIVSYINNLVPISSGISVEEQIDHRFEFVEWAIPFFIDNPNTDLDFNDLLNSRTGFDTETGDTGDIDNNSEGGYLDDDYEMVDLNNLQQNWPTISSVIETSDFVGWREQLTSDGRLLSCMDFAKEQITKKGYQISDYYAPGQTIQVYTESDGVNSEEMEKRIKLS